MRRRWESREPQLQKPKPQQPAQPRRSSSKDRLRRARSRFFLELGLESGDGAFSVDSLLRETLSTLEGNSGGALWAQMYRALFQQQRHLEESVASPRV